MKVLPKYESIPTFIDEPIIQGANSQALIVYKCERRTDGSITFYIALSPIKDRLFQLNSAFGSPKRRNEWPKLFVLMAFHDSMKPVYDDHIRNVASSLNLSCARADDFFSTGSIMHEVWSAICYADIIIAECTGRNPNVFYEIGISHAIGKPTILIAQKIDDIPFDLRHLRTIIYDYTPRGGNMLESKLKATIEEIRKGSTQVSGGGGNS